MGDESVTRQQQTLCGWTVRRPDTQAARSVPVLSAQRAKRFLISSRYADAASRCRRGRKCWARGPYADTKRWACPADLSPCMRYARCRVGRCEFSQRLFSERLWRCSTPGEALAFRCAVALQLLRDDDLRDISQAFEQLVKKLLGCLLVVPALHQNIRHVILLVNRAPQVMPLPMDRHKHLVQVPFVAWVGVSTLQPDWHSPAHIADTTGGWLRGGRRYRAHTRARARRGSLKGIGSTARHHG